MIVSIGEVTTALHATKAGLSAMYAGPVPQTEEGLQFLEFLIDNCILFDPVFCNSTQFTADQLETVFSLNSDIRVVFIGGECLDSAENRDLFYEALKDRKNIKVFINAASCQLEGRLSDICCLVRMDKAEAEKLTSEQREMLGKRLLVTENASEDCDAKIAASLHNNGNGDSITACL